MDAEKTKSEFIFDRLRAAIENGLLPSGSRLLSTRRLANSFGANVNTVTKALERLEREGYISVAPKKAAVISYKSSPADPRSTARDILRHREDILSFYRVKAMTLPPLMSFAAVNHGPMHFESIIPAVRKLPPELRRRKVMWVLYSDVFPREGNPFFRRLLAAFDYNSSYAGTLMKYLPATKGEPISERLFEVLDMRSGKNKLAALSGIYRSMADGVQEALDVLAGELPEEVVSLPAGEAHWELENREEDLCSAILGDIHEKIGLGVYPAGSFLPHEGELAEYYGVSVCTLRKALGELNRRGLCRTFNVKGTMVLPIPELAPEGLYENRRLIRDASEYLYALQLKILLIRPAALSAAEKFLKDSKPGDVEAIVRELRSYSDKPSIAALENFILSGQEYPQMRGILKDVELKVPSGKFFAFFKDRDSAASNTDQRCAEPARCLIRNDAAGFSEGCADIYIDIMAEAKEQLVKKYSLTALENIAVPDKLRR